MPMTKITIITAMIPATSFRIQFASSR